MKNNLEPNLVAMTCEIISHGLGRWNHVIVGDVSNHLNELVDKILQK